VSARRALQRHATLLKVQEGIVPVEAAHELAKLFGSPRDDACAGSRHGDGLLRVGNHSQNFPFSTYPVV